MAVTGADVAPSITLSEEGLSVTEVTALLVPVIVMTELADLVGSTALVAVTVQVPVVPGAVNRALFPVPPALLKAINKLPA